MDTPDRARGARARSARFILLLLACTACQEGPGKANLVVPHIPNLVPARTIGSTCDGTPADACDLDGEDPSLRGATKLGPNLFRVEARNFDRCKLHQATTESCWAACASMIRSYHRRPLDQAVLIEKFAGGLDDQTMSEDQIARALAYSKEREDKIPSLAIRGEISPAPMSEDDCVRNLHHQQPVLIGVRAGGDSGGHILVAYAATFRLLRKTIRFDGPAPQWAIVELETMDPFPDPPAVRKLACAELKDQVDFAMTLRTAEEAVDTYIRNAARNNVQVNVPRRGR